MKKRKKVVICLLSLIFIHVTIMTISSMLSPLNKPEEEIKSDVLKLIPIGMSKERVIRIIENHDKWEIRHINYVTGYRPPKFPPGGGEVVGVTSINVYAGSHRNPRYFFINTYVNILFGFDEDGKLIDIYIWKTYDTI